MNTITNITITTYYEEYEVSRQVVGEVSSV